MSNYTLPLVQPYLFAVDLNTISVKPIAMISGASDYIASATFPELTPSLGYAIAAITAISVAAVAYQATKPVIADFDLQGSCQASSDDDSDSQSEWSEVTNEDTDTVVAADSSSVTGYVGYLVMQLNLAMVEISNYLADFVATIDNVMTKISEDLSSVWSGMTSLVVSHDGQKSVDAVSLEDTTSKADVVSVCGDSDCGCDHRHTPSV